MSLFVSNNTAPAVDKKHSKFQRGAFQRVIIMMLAFALCVTGIPLSSAIAQLPEEGTDISQSIKLKAHYQQLQEDDTWLDLEQKNWSDLFESTWEKDSEEAKSSFQIALDWELKKGESASNADYFTFEIAHPGQAFTSQNFFDAQGNVLGTIEIDNKGQGKATLVQSEAVLSDQEDIDYSSGTIELGFEKSKTSQNDLQENEIVPIKKEDTSTEAVASQKNPTPFGGPVAYGPTGDPNDAGSIGQISLVKYEQLANGCMGGQALDGAGRVWTFGYNLFGELGIGVTSAQQMYYGGMKRVPYFIDNNIEVVKIGSTYETRFALSSAGDVYAWGEGFSGEMGNGTRVDANPNITMVPGLPKIVDIFVSSSYVYDAGGAVFALADDGRLFTWGLNFGGKLGIGSGTVYITSPTEVNLGALDPGFTSGSKKVVKVSSGRASSQLIDSDGDLWLAGSNGYGEQGGTGASNTFRKLDRSTYSMGRIIDSDAGYSIAVAGDRVVVADENGDVWEWGAATGDAGDKNITVSKTTPQKIGLSAAEITAIGYTPRAESVSSGMHNGQFIDQHGRSWMWGNGVYYGFGNEGGNIPHYTVQRVYSTAAEQWPKEIGDGDTQSYEYSAKTPIYLGGTKAANTYYGYGIDRLHPTIYDEKYMLRDTSGYVLDEEGNRIKYASGTNVDGVAGLTIGMYYLCTPAGNIDPSRTTKIPALNPEDAMWINLAFQSLPYLKEFDISLSAYAFLDYDGNIFKWGYDGAGSIAWGMDWEQKYDGAPYASSSAHVGLADRYCYEVMYMRGAPTIDKVNMNAGLKNDVKVYKDPQTGTVTNTAEIKLHIPKTISNTLLDADVHSDVNELMYVIVPYDTSDPSFSVDTSAMTYDQFMTLYNGAAANHKGSLINAPITSGAAVQDLTYEVNIPDNGRLITWLVNERYVDGPNGTKEYVNIDQISSAFVADNVYTPVSMNHEGVGVWFDNSEQALYSPTTDNVVKTNNDSVQTQKPFDETLYGLPLDGNNKVIGATKASDGSITVDPSAVPTYGYDTTEIKSYEAVSDVGLPTGIKPYWKFKTYLDAAQTQLQPTIVSKDMNDEGLLSAGYAHTFYYEPDADYWTEVKGEKTWVDNNDKLGFRPIKIELTLKQYERNTTTGAKGAYIQDIATIDVTPDAQGQWLFDFGWQKTYEYTYEIVETAIPLYTTAISYPNAGGTGIHEDFTGIEIVNTLNVKPIKFNKVDPSGNPIVSDVAIFSLTNANAGQDVYDENGNPQSSVQLSTSAANPYIVMPIQKPGDYLLTETKAPAGYNLLTMPIEIKVDASGNVTAMLGALALDEVVLTGSDAITYSKGFNIANKGASELPKAGGAGTIFLLAISSIVLLLASILMHKRRKYLVPEQE